MLICILVSCSTQHITSGNRGKQHVFLLEDKDSSKIFLNDCVKVIYKKKTLINSPLIAIDGIVFRYDKELDTIVLPLKRNDINNVVFLDKNSSSIIYGKKETNGAIIINTVYFKIKPN